MFKTKEIRFPIQDLYSPPSVRISDSEDSESTLEDLPHYGLAIVGTRKPSLAAMDYTRRFIASLKNTRIIIVSGLALGIDSIAHQTALEYGLRTVGVLGGGIHRFYPKSNLLLASQIIENKGVLLSEYDDHESPKRHYFLERNRIIASLSKAVVVMQAGFRSGSLNTASWARQLERDVYSCSAHPTEMGFEGNLNLISKHQAFPLCHPCDLGTTWFELASLPDLNLPQNSLF